MFHCSHRPGPPAPGALSQRGMEAWSVGSQGRATGARGPDPSERVSRSDPSIVGACPYRPEFLPGAGGAEPGGLRSRLPSDNPPSVSVGTYSTLPAAPELTS